MLSLQKRLAQKTSTHSLSSPPPQWNFTPSILSHLPASQTTPIAVSWEDLTDLSVADTEVASSKFVLSGNIMYVQDFYPLLFVLLGFDCCCAAQGVLPRVYCLLHHRPDMEVRFSEVWEKMRPADNGIENEQYNEWFCNVRNKKCLQNFRCKVNRKIRCRWEDNIKMDLRENRVDVDWINLAKIGAY
jgi:hypothetical protein